MSKEVEFSGLKNEISKYNSKNKVLILKNFSSSYTLICTENFYEEIKKSEWMKNMINYGLKDDVVDTLQLVKNTPIFNIIYISLPLNISINKQDISNLLKPFSSWFRVFNYVIRKKKNCYSIHFKAVSGKNMSIIFYYLSSSKWENSEDIIVSWMEKKDESFPSVKYQNKEIELNIEDCLL